MYREEIKVGESVKHEDEVWEIIRIDMSSNEVQLLHKTVKITCWIPFSEVKLTPSYSR